MFGVRSVVSEKQLKWAILFSRYNFEIGCFFYRWKNGICEEWMVAATE